MAKKNLLDKLDKLTYRIILKDSANRAVVEDIPFLKLGNGSGEKKLKKAYEKLLADEKEYQKNNS